ncbi:hypothetical protein AVEN_64659-1 [Araneus ventricosus]|uniref:Uncharacterized protein n=1 Tax=Araneus ventricosus TaxID=182803 RepID=A0A4Y2KCA6_ARAVE|nr:hypothetical protein AVEN_64659-1 [Araneus ventricosus]
MKAYLQQLRKTRSTGTGTIVLAQITNGIDNNSQVMTVQRFDIQQHKQSATISNDNNSSAHQLISSHSDRTHIFTMDQHSYRSASTATGSHSG